MTREPDDPQQPPITPFLPHQEFPPPSTTVKVEFGAHSRPGKHRLVNEDHYLVMRLGRHQETLLTSLAAGVIPTRFDEYGYAMVVADGLGGAGTGEIASRLAIETLMHLILHFGKWNLRIDERIAQEVIDRAERFYRHVDVAVLHRGQTEGIPGLQTTLTAAFGAGHDLFFAHVGHSRAYMFRKGALLRLTRDHTISQQGADVPLAPLVDVNVTARDLRHILTDTIGMGGSVGPKIDLQHLELVDKDTVVVCTNGLTDVVDEDIIAQELGSDRSAVELSQRLVDLALASGGQDDVTVLVARYCVPA